MELSVNKSYLTTTYFVKRKNYHKKYLAFRVARCDKKKLRNKNTEQVLAFDTLII